MEPANSPEPPAPDQPKGLHCPWWLQVPIAVGVTILLAYPKDVAREIRELLADKPAHKAPADPQKK